MAASVHIVRGDTNVTVLGCKFDVVPDASAELLPRKAELPPPWRMRVVPDAYRGDARAALELFSLAVPSAASASSTTAAAAAGGGFRGERDYPAGHYVVLVPETEPAADGKPVWKAYPIGDWYAFTKSRSISQDAINRQVEVAEKLLEIGDRPTAVAKMKERYEQSKAREVDSSSRAFALTGMGAEEAEEAMQKRRQEAIMASAMGRGAAGRGGGGLAGIQLEADDLEGAYTLLLREKSKRGLGYEYTDTRTFDVLGGAGDDEAGGADMNAMFDDDVGDQGEMEPAEEDFAARRGVDAGEAQVGEVALMGEEEAEADALVGAGEDGVEGGDSSGMDFERVIRLAAANAAAAGSGSASGPTIPTPSTVLTAPTGEDGGAGGGGMVGMKRPASAMTGGAGAEDEGEGDVAPPPKRARGEGGDYATDPVTVLRERLRRLLVSLGNRVTMKVVSREFAHELNTQGPSFKTMLANVMKSMTRRMLSADNETYEYVLKDA